MASSRVSTWWRNELPPKVVKMLAKQALGFRKESDDDVPLELLLEPQEKSEQAGQHLV